MVAEKPTAASGRDPNPLPAWNRDEWFRLMLQTGPGSPVGETGKFEYAGMGHALLTALSNATDIIEAVVGAGRHQLFTRAWMTWQIEAFRKSRTPPRSAR